jgi:hypothetical protein
VLQVKGKSLDCGPQGVSLLDLSTLLSFIVVAGGCQSLMRQVGF